MDRGICGNNRIDILSLIVTSIEIKYEWVYPIIIRMENNGFWLHREVMQML